jgi:hypothetical protein
MTEDPYSTQGWNRYAYVGNSPLNFTDPSGYCFLGCFWKPLFKAIGKFFQKTFAAIVQVAATALLCSGPLAPVCAGVIAFAVTGVTSGDLGLALRAGVTAAFTAFAMDAVGTATLGQGHPMPDFLSPAHLRNIAGHALVGCASAVMGGAKCGPGALSAAAGSFAGPVLKGLGAQRNLVAHAVVGGVVSVAAGGNFANGAVTAAFGYLFNECGGASSHCFGVPKERLGEGALLSEWWQQWVRDFRAGVTHSLEFSVEFTAGAGLNAGGGLLLNLGSTAEPRVEYGGFLFVGEMIGANAGAGLQYGANLGTVPNFQAATVRNLNVVPIGGSMMSAPGIGPSGFSLGGAASLGVSSSANITTCVYTNLRSGC